MPSSQPEKHMTNPLPRLSEILAQLISIRADMLDDLLNIFSMKAEKKKEEKRKYRKSGLTFTFFATNMLVVLADQYCDNARRGSFIKMSKARA